MTFLYIFPHPDDESFGPAPAIARQVREGHEVHLLTLTKGGATKIRHDLDLSVEEMGAVREEEVQCAAEAIGATVTVLDFPDGGLAGLDPRDLEHVIERKIEAVLPDVVVTYGVHGNSGHPDHITTHAVVKRAYCAACDELVGRSPRRLAFFTLVEGEIEDAPVRLQGVPRGALGAVVPFSDDDRQRAERARLLRDLRRGDRRAPAAPAGHRRRPVCPVRGGARRAARQPHRRPPRRGLTCRSCASRSRAGRAGGPSPPASSAACR